MHLGSGALCMHVTYVPSTCLLSEQIENTSLTFPVWLHDAVQQTVLGRKFIPQLAVSEVLLIKHQEWHSSGIYMKPNQRCFRGVCMLPTGNCSLHGSVEGGGWTRQDNQQGGV